MKAVFSLFAIVTLCACATSTSPSNDGWAAFGKSTIAGPLVVTPIRVTEDSRCPMNARCAWAGRVVVEVNLAAPNGTQTGLVQSDQPLAIANGSLVLEDIEPASFMTSDHPEPTDYRFKFSFH